MKNKLTLYKLVRQSRNFSSLKYSVRDERSWASHELGTHRHIIVEYPNEWGASIIQRPEISYGAEDELWELMVLKRDFRDGVYKYTSLNPICSDVLGWLNEYEVIAYLEKIRNI